jgi:uncharacterized protein involved in exopolysaccharide biosynthesis
MNHAHHPPASGNQSQPHHEAGGFDWREYHFAIKSRAWIIILCVMLATLWGIFSAATQQGLYKARSVLFIEQVKSNILSIKVEEVRDEQIKSIDMINTLVDLLRSYPFALRVANRLKLGQDRAFLSAAGISGGEASPERAAGALTGMVSASYRLNTRLIDIFITTRNADVSVKLANAYAEEYLHYVRDQKSEATRSASTFLMEESRRQAERVNEIEQQIEAFKNRHAGRLPEQVELNAQMVERSQLEIERLSRELTTLSDRRGFLEAQIANLADAGSSTTASEQSNNPAERLRAARTQLAVVSSLYSENHPDQIRLRREIEGLERLVGRSPGGAGRESTRQLDEARIALARAAER